MKLVVLAIVLGFVLSWVELEGLRRSVQKLLHSEKNSGKAWAWSFALRYTGLAVAFWFFLNLFKENILPFILSFIFSNLILRHWYGSKVYA